MSCSYITLEPTDLADFVSEHKLQKIGEGDMYKLPNSHCAEICQVGERLLITRYGLNVIDDIVQDCASEDEDDYYELLEL